MSAAATWSTKATPLVRVVGCVVFTLGVLCIVHAAVTLALGGGAWTLPAYTCLALAGLLVCLRILREWRYPTHILHWDTEVDAFRVHAIPGIMDLMHAWHGPAWVTLSLRRRAQDARPVRLVIWKSTVPSPYWSELVLRTQVGGSREQGHQNKENP